MQSMSYTASAWCHVTTIRRSGKEAPRRGQATLGVGQPLTGPSCHHLNLVGLWGCIGYAREVLHQLEII
jgi:hypothetical protein